MSRTVAYALGSVGIGLLVLALKFAAYQVTGSTALLSDAMESIVNVATAIAALIAVRVAARPPDSNHPFGHHKAELLSAILEGVLIVLAALLIFRSAAIALMDPRPLTAPVAGLALNALAGALNWIWYRQLLRVGRQERSPALTADGYHLRSDVVSSLAVIAGVVLVVLTGWTMLDPLIAILAGINILWHGWHVIRDSVGGLMDEAVPEETLAEIRAIIAASAAGAMQTHDLRTRHAGSATFIEFHLVVPGQLRVDEAHALCDRIEDALEARIADARVTIHVEPDSEFKRSGAPVRASGAKA